MSVRRIFVAIAILAIASVQHTRAHSSGEPIHAATRQVTDTPAGLSDVVRVLDFEPDSNGLFPNGAVAEDEMIVIDMFESSHGMRFGMDYDGDGFPDGKSFLSLEQAGSEDLDSAFYYDHTGEADRAAPEFAERLGRFFLFARFSGPGESAVILYTPRVARATGEIWDLDGTPRYGTEQWLVEATDSRGSVVSTARSPVGDQTFEYDGRPWGWVVEADRPVIASVRLWFTGSKTDGIGLALDNFTAEDAALAGQRCYLPFGINLLSDHFGDIDPASGP
jgi:hypothetical protein